MLPIANEFSNNVLLVTLTLITFTKNTTIKILMYYIII